MTPRLLAIIEAARDPHRRGKLTGTEIAELADAAERSEQIIEMALACVKAARDPARGSQERQPRENAERAVDHWLYTLGALTDAKASP